MKRPVASLGVLWLCLLPCTAVGWDFRVADGERLTGDVDLREFDLNTLLYYVR